MRAREASKLILGTTQGSREDRAKLIANEDALNLYLLSRKEENITSNN